MKFDLYQTNDQWRWRVKTPNGRIVGESGESYKNPQDAVKGFNRVWGITLQDIQTGCKVAGFAYDLVTGKIKRS